MQKRIARNRHFRGIFLWSLAGIALLQLGLGSAIDVAWPGVRDPEYVHREQLLREQLATNDGKPLVMVLGSSRVQNGFDAGTAGATLDDAALVFNFGIPTSGPYLERVWMERLHARGVKPDVLLIEVIPMHYNAKRSPPDLRSLNGARLSALEVTDMPATDYTVSAVRRWLVGRAIPVIQHKAELRAHLGLDDAGRSEFAHPDLKAIDSLGWQPRSHSAETGAILKNLAHRQYDPLYGDFQLSQRQVRLLAESLEYCRQEGIRVALLLSPEGSEFRRLWSPAMSLAMEGMFADLRQRFGVSVVDARTWMADDCFFDMHHLRPEGARAFSERLAREAIAPLLRDRTSARRNSAH